MCVFSTIEFALANEQHVDSGPSTITFKKEFDIEKNFSLFKNEMKKRDEY